MQFPSPEKKLPDSSATFVINFIGFSLVFSGVYLMTHPFQSVTCSMDYTHLQRFGLDDPLAEEINLCSSNAVQVFPYPAHISPFPPISLSTADPALLQTSEHAWLKGVKISPADNIGVDASGHLPHQCPNIVMQNSQFNLPADMMTTAFSSNSFQFGGDVASHAQWRQMCSLSSEDYLNHAMPQLISDSGVQQACLYASSSDCPQETDSSGSSERARPSLDRSCLVGSSSDEMNSSWQISDLLQGNLGSSTTGLPLDELTNDSSSVAAHLDTLDSSRNALRFLVSIPAPAHDCRPLGPVSSMPPCTIELSSSLIATSRLNQDIPILHPFGASLSTHSNGAPPYKRQRASYTLENSSARPWSKPVIPSLSRSASTNTLGSDYPMTSSNFTDALYKDFHVSRRQAMSLLKPTVLEGVGGSAAKRDQLDKDLKSRLEYLPEYLQKQNATSIEPQSVAARHRRRKISERVRILEKLIPSRNKMDTASMLDECIEYVKFLQLQVQLLETLEDMSYGNSVTSTPSLYNETIGRGKDGLESLRTSSLSSQVSQSFKIMQLMRPAASPFILSEILQQQLFKQRLCLVSLRQCPPPLAGSRHLAGTYA